MCVTRSISYRAGTLLTMIRYTANEATHAVFGRFFLAFPLALVLFAPALLHPAVALSAPPSSMIVTVQGADSDVDLEEKRTLLLATDETQRGLAADDLVRARIEEADNVIREILTGKVTGAHERAIVSLLEVIRVRGVVRFLPEVLDLTLYGNGNGGGIKETAQNTILGMRGSAAAEAELISIFRSSTDNPGRRLQTVKFLRDLRSLECLAMFIEVGSTEPSPGPRLERELVQALESITGERFGADWKQWNDWKTEYIRVDQDGVLDRGRVQVRISESLRERFAEVDAALIEAMRQYLDELSRRSTTDVSAYRGVLEEILGENPYPALRAEAAERIGAFDDTQVKPADAEMLLEAFADDSPDVQVAAVRAIGRLAAVKRESQNWSAELIDRLESEVVRQLRSDFVDVKRAAVEAAGRVGGARCSGALVRLLEDLIERDWSDASLRGSIIQALAQSTSGTGRVVPVLAKTLREDPVWTHRQFAARTLGLIELEDVVAPLAATLGLTTERKEVRWQAANSLGQKDSDAALEALLTGLADEDEAIREICARSVGKIGRGEPSTRLIEMLATESSDFVRKTVVSSLGKLGDVGAVDPMFVLLGEAEPELVQEIERALDSIWQNSKQRVDGGESLLALNRPVLVPFAVRVLEKADKLAAETPPDDPDRIRGAIALANAYRLSGKLDAADEILTRLAAFEDKMVASTLCDLMVSRNRQVAARGRAAQAARALEEAAARFDQSGEERWRLIAVAAEILVAAAEDTKDEAERDRFYVLAREILGDARRPSNLPAALTDRLEGLLATIGERAPATTPTPGPDAAERDRIEDLLLSLASEVRQKDPKQAEAAIKELGGFAAEKKVPVLLGLLEHAQENVRRVGIDFLRGMFPDETLEFEPTAEPADRAASIATLRTWWDDRPRTESSSADNG